MNDRVRGWFPAVHVGLGAALALGARTLLRKGLLVKFRRDVRALGKGDYGPILAAYADDASIHFNEGDHRWSGVHRGRAQLERFFRNFVAAGISGEIRDLYIAGPPWRLTLVVRFDDRAETEDGTELYANRTVLVLETRWGRVAKQEDYWVDTGRIEVFEARLRELGIVAT